jgi:hypothetical protein
MVTTRRANTNVTSSVLDRNTAGGVDVLERTKPAIQEFNSEREETVDEARARMRGNLDLLLNYDRYSETVVDDVVSPVVEKSPEMVAETTSFQDEDIRPTSTTMQFGDADADQIYNEMRREEKAVGYKLNGKGKLVVVLYALAVTVILALIIINTGVLARLSGVKETKTAELNQRIEQFEQLSSDIENISGNDYVIEQAENLGMIKR